MGIGWKKTSSITHFGGFHSFLLSILLFRGEFLVSDVGRERGQPLSLSGPKSGLALGGDSVSNSIIAESTPSFYSVSCLFDGEWR